MGVTEQLVHTLNQHGIAVPTPVQAETIPVVLSGEDVVSQAQTGTGKTLAFLLPIIQRIDASSTHVQALIVAPTRELALQITAEAKKLIEAYKGVNVLAVYGGQDVERQMRKLQGGRQLVIGTPGRLLDHLRRGTISLSKVKTLVLDEADQMLHMGFLGEVEEIIRQIPTNRQTLLFSATMPVNVRRLAERFMRSPIDIHVQSERITVKNVKQIVVQTTDRAKQATLCKLIDEHRPYQAIIFCRTKRRASKLNEELLEMGYDSDELHGDLSQSKREQVMERFRKVKMQLLVATDVAARGLDVEGITHVFNYDVPQDAESYIHRIGRTGRAGAQGIAITFASPRDRMAVELIERGIGQKLERRNQDGEHTEDAGDVRTGRGKKSDNERSSGRGGRGNSRGTRSDAKDARGQGAGRGGRGAARGKQGSDAGGRSGRREARNEGHGGRSSACDGRGQGRSSRSQSSQGAGRQESRGKSGGQSSGRSSQGGGRSSGRGGGRRSR
ncbi:DEAD/DEAH box helicase [Paenibacillus sp. E194]|uniref:DEAD/DEAH box helicase n=1 Tax=Paenibacillus sp. E194 TaxID=1458845 RepID=UPI0005E23CA8|nr:DEAD/DEAH box helicase [Paenibacillus sp. E194]KJB89116.1 DEAD/DEAH box helicase [Paenibacillus sp. E194]